MNRETTTAAGLSRIRLLGVVSILGVGLLWASWPVVGEMAGRWWHDPRYTHGFLVPVFALYLLWRRRGVLASTPLKPSGWGIALIVAGGALKLAGARYYIAWFEALSLLPELGGIALLVGGRTALRWAGPAIAFLVFMIPLPYRAEMALGYPLQRISTLASNYTLQTIGLPAVAEGNVIVLEHGKVGVVEACNGLGMLFMFLAFTVAVALVSERPVTDKLLIILSTAPIALAANVVRIAATALLHETVGGRVADVVYHDLAGWLMMPLALAALWTELSLLSLLFIAREADRPMPILIVPGVGGGRGGASEQHHDREPNRRLHGDRASNP